MTGTPRIRIGSWRSTHWRLAAITLCGALVGRESAANQKVGVEDEARKILTAFDAAWSARDLDELIAPYSAKFGCALYGGVDREVLAHALATMRNEMLPDTRCRTRVVSCIHHSPTAQAFVTREFHDPDGSMREQQWHVFYLQRRNEGSGARVSGATSPLEIVALEEFDPSALDQFRDGKYVGRTSSLRFDLPDEMFAVSPPCSASIDRVTLRTPDLEDEIRITVKCFADAFDVRRKLDADYQSWQNGRVDADIRQRREPTILGRQSVRIDVTYHGPSCQLDPHGRTDSVERALVRIYVPLDSAVLLAIDLDSSRARLDAMNSRLDALLRSLRIEESDAKPVSIAPAGYGKRLFERLGLGQLANDTYRDMDARLEVKAPDGFSLRRVPSDAKFALEARSLDPTRTPLSIRIEAVEPSEPELTIENLVAFEDLGFADSCDQLGTSRPTIQYTDLKTGELGVLQVERKAEAAPTGTNRVQLARYFRLGKTIFVVETSIASTDDKIAALRGLDAVISRIRQH